MFQNSGLWRPVCDCVAWLLCMPCGSPLAPLHTHCPACPLPEAVRPPGAGGAPNWASLPQGQVLLESQPPVAWRTSWPVVGGDGAGAVSSMALSRPEARVTAQPRWLALGGGHRAVPAGTSAPRTQWKPAKAASHHATHPTYPLKAHRAGWREAEMGLQVCPCYARDLGTLALFPPKVK